MNFQPYQIQGMTPYGYQRQEYMQPAQLVMGQQMQQAGFSCRPVTSKEEAAVAQIPLDGSTHYFVDTGNGKIYAKAFRADGTAPLVTYTRESEPAPVQYVTMQEFNALRDELEWARKPVGRAVKQDDE